MARKERNNVDYFPHPVSHGRKMFYLRSKFNNDGYSVWFMLLEELGKSDYHFLDLSDKIQIMYLSSQFLVGEDVLLDIINILVEFDEFDRDLWVEHKILYNQKFISNISDAYKKRNNSCIDKNSLLILLTNKGILLPTKSIPIQDLSDIKVTGNTQRKVEKSKVEKSKGFSPPSLEEVELYFEENEYPKSIGKKAFQYYHVADWKDSKGNAVKNWKQKMQSVWFKDENKINKQEPTVQHEDIPQELKEMMGIIDRKPVGGING